MTEYWRLNTGCTFSIVREAQATPGAPIYHFLVEMPGEDLGVTECGNGAPRGGEWMAMDGQTYDLYDLDQICRECAVGLGRRAERAQQ